MGKLIDRKREEEQPRILFSVPTSQYIDARVVHSMMEIIRHPCIEYKQMMGAPIDQGRNQLAQATIDGNYTHLMMLDSDTMPPGDIVELLLSCEWPMAGAICPFLNTAKDGRRIVTANFQEMPKHLQESPRWATDWGQHEEPFEVWALGTACVLISREVFEAIEWPWFAWRLHKDDKTPGWTDDVYFSKKARDAGYRFKVHPAALCRHFKMMDVLEVVGCVQHLLETMSVENKEQLVAGMF